VGSCAADPWGMLAWYALLKPIYLWQFVNIDVVGDVLVYPVRGAPFDSDFLLAVTHAAMRALAADRARRGGFDPGLAANRGEASAGRAGARAAHREPAADLPRARDHPFE
jgi:hypothetical protein